jgi:hypothetical protein
MMLTVRSVRSGLRRFVLAAGVIAALAPATAVASPLNTGICRR